MTTSVIALIYILIGAAGSVVVLIKKCPVGSLRGPSAGVVILFCWPFLLPAALMTEDIHTDSDRSRRIAELGQAVREFETRMDMDRERQAIDAFIVRLRKGEARIRELDIAILRARTSVGEKLHAMRQEAKDEVDEGCMLLEEIIAQLTVLKFAERGSLQRQQDERASVEDLLVRIETRVSLA